LCNDLLFANGAYAEYVRVPARIVEENCLTIPADLPAAKAALVEPLACAVKGVEDVAIQEGEKVLVIGAGPLGLMLARCWPAQRSPRLMTNQIDLPSPLNWA
jgi:L-iditol 2-dehydrogenase